MNGERLKRIRSYLNLSQQEFGDRLGLSQKTVSRYEKNERDIPIEVLYLLNRDFGINMNWFFSGYGDMVEFDIKNGDLESFLSRKRVVNGIVSDPHLYEIFIHLEEKPVLKDLLYLVLKAHREYPESIDEYLKLLEKYLKETQ